MPPDQIPAEGTQKAQIIGGPEATAPAATPPAATTTPPAPSAPLYKGVGGEFKTLEELTDYTKNLEAKLVTSAARSNPAPEAPPPAAPQNEDDEFYSKIGDEFFQDPAAAVKKIESRVETRMEKKKVQADQRTAFWNEFYQENPDLKGLETVVKSIVTEKNSEITPLPIPKAKELIASEARKVIVAVKANAGMTETELPTGGATVIGASGAAGSRNAPPARNAPVTFIDQVKELRARRMGSK